MIERNTISGSEFQNLLKEVRKTLPGAVGRTDVSLERKWEIVLELPDVQKDWSRPMAGGVVDRMMRVFCTTAPRQ
jgi:hypothetical protein